MKRVANSVRRGNPEKWWTTALQDPHLKAAGAALTVALGAVCADVTVGREVENARRIRELLEKVARGTLPNVGGKGPALIGLFACLLLNTQLTAKWKTWAAVADELDQEGNPKWAECWRVFTSAVGMKFFAFAVAVLESIHWAYPQVCKSNEAPGHSGGGMTRWLKMNLLLDDDSEDTREEVRDLDKKRSFGTWDSIATHVDDKAMNLVAGDTGVYSISAAWTQDDWESNGED